MANKFIDFNIRVKRDEVRETLKILKQRGTSNTAIDSARSALPPGKRRSKTGKIYWETRRAHSDAVGKRI